MEKDFEITKKQSKGCFDCFFSYLPIGEPEGTCKKSISKLIVKVNQNEKRKRGHKGNFEEILWQF